MDKKVAALLGTAAGLAAMGASPASASVAPLPATAVTSYADLLTPIPNAMAALVADDASRSDEAAMLPQNAKVADYHHHHHHHHTRKIIIKRHYRHHHHHHHHHHNRRHHHHHHDHHSFLGLGVGIKS